MPTNFTGSTFKDTYKDDWTDSAGFHKILFNSGRALQARELTQLQTILQEQIRRFASNIFLDGAAVNPRGSGGSNLYTLDYVIVNELLKPAASYVGQTFQGTPRTGQTSGLVFEIVKVETDAGLTAADEPSGAAVLYGRYLSANQASETPALQANPLTFNDAEVITDVRSTSSDTLTVRTQSAFGGQPTSTGRGLLFSNQACDFFTNGHFVHAPKQSIVLSRYSDTNISTTVGFEVQQDILTVADDQSLYDNQGARPNLAAPGADRYRILLNLTTKDTIANTDDLLTFCTIVDSKIAKIKSGDDSYNFIERRMAKRHHNTHGDFIVNPWTIKFEEGDSDGALKLNVPGTVDGIAPTGFLNGFFLQQKLDQTFDIPKPQSTFTSPIYNDTFFYGGYVTADSDGLATFLNGTKDVGFEEQQLYTLADASNSLLGKARIRSIVDTEYDTDRYEIYLYDIRMEPTKNFRDVAKIFHPSDGNSHSITVNLEDSQLYQRALGLKQSFFGIGGPRVKEIDMTVFTMVCTDTVSDASDGSGVLTFNLPNSAYTNADEAEWLFINTSDNAIENVPPNNITTTLGSCVVTGLTASKNYTIIYYFNKPAGTVTPKTKTYTERYIGFSRVTDSAGGVYYKTDSSYAAPYYDGVKLISAHPVTGDFGGSFTVDSSRELRDLISFDGGQRDNFYQPITFQASNIEEGTKIYAKVGYFEWGGAGDLFCVNSYVFRDSATATDQNPFFQYADIPEYFSKTDGFTYSLFNILDFRPALDPFDTSTGTVNETQTAKTFHMPKNQSAYQLQADFYNQRVDHIVLGYDKEFMQADIRINQGTEGLPPPEPPLNQDELLLYTIRYGGNTLNSQDMAIRRHTYKGYKMSDIGMLEQRIARAEETIALTTSEQDAKNLVELNADGTVRSKTGFFVEDFHAGMQYAAGQFDLEYSEDFRFMGQSYNPARFTVQPKQMKQSVTFLYDELDRYSGARGSSVTVPAKSNVTQTNPVSSVKGDNIYLDYVQVLDSSLVQEKISWFSDGRSYEEMGYYNVNPFNVFTGEGFIKLSPASDYWVDHRRLPDNIIDGGTNIKRRFPRGFHGIGNWEQFGWQGNTLPNGLDPSTLQEGQEVANITQRITVMRTGTWRRKGTGEIFTATLPWTRTFNIRDVVTNVETIEKNLGDKVVQLTNVPWMRQRKIFGKIQGLRPYTRYWPFFNGINVSQWVIRRTPTEYNEAIAKKWHLRTWGDVNVNYNSHPDAAGLTDPNTLISDEFGNIEFSFWLPNSAPVPSEKEGGLTTIQEWREWAANQRREARKYAGIKDPKVYDQIGWKFRSGAKEFAVYDVSSGIVDDALSLARTIYTSSGSLRIAQAQIHTTRNVTITRFVRRIQQDPLAQTFMIGGGEELPGAFVTKVEVFLRSAPNCTWKGKDNQPKIPIELQLRGVENGFPLQDAIADTHRVFVDADTAAATVNAMSTDGPPEDLDAVLANPLEFVFDEPIYLRAGTEYAIVLKSECDFYEAFVGETYGLILGKTDKRVNKQPAKGSLFLSQNGSTWTPKQTQDMAYRIYTAKFKPEGHANFYNDKLDKYVHNTPTSFLADSADLSKLYILHSGHGLGVGDSAGLSGLVDSSTYNGLSGAFLQKTRLVDSADALGYSIRLDSAGGSPAFTNAGVFGATTAETNQAVNINEFLPDFMTLNIEGTNVTYRGSFVSGIDHYLLSSSSTADPRYDIDNGFTQLGNNQKVYFPSPKYLAYPSAEVTEIDTAGDSDPSIIITAEINSTQESTFGGPLAAHYAKPANGGYISDVSPVIDTQRISAVLTSNFIDNQVQDSAGGNGLNAPRSLRQNKPSLYSPETHPWAGTALSKHITKPILFEQETNGMRVIVNAHVPPAASFDLYYRVARTQDVDFYTIPWTLGNDALTNSPSKNAWVDNDVEERANQDYEYLIGGELGDLDDFTGVQFKLVFNSTNTSQVPIINSIRAIGLI